MTNYFVTAIFVIVITGIKRLMAISITTAPIVKKKFTPISGKRKYKKKLNAWNA